MKKALRIAPFSKSISRLLCPALMLAALGAQAASVGVNGYTNDFSVQPAAADFATANIGGGSGDITDAVTFNAAVASLTAASINTQLPSAAGAPPGATATSVFNDTDKNLQLRPTGVKMHVIMATLMNNSGGNASSVSIIYNLLQSTIIGEEVTGLRVYYSLTGVANSWVNVPGLNATAAGQVSANVTLGGPWNVGSPLYILFADDNGSGSPDTANQIDNFSAAVSGFTAELPVAIVTQPQNLTVNETQPATFTVGTSGHQPITYQWFRGASPITDATNASYSIPSTVVGDNGAQFKVVAANVASNVNYSATSAVATLTVNVDTNPPTLVLAQALGLGQVQVFFSERVTSATATTLANYSITSTNGNITIASITIDASLTNVTLNVSPMTDGTTYTLTVNSITDLSGSANMIAANSQTNFLAASYAPVNIGGALPAGGSTPVAGGYNISGGGSDIGGTTDQFLLSYQLRSGNFDIKVRMPAFSQSDALAKAGLMARGSLAANSPYVAVLATPSISGSFFQSRATVGGATTSSGNIPVNFPYTWLRLQRAGNVFTGYISYDGLSWAQLGSVTLALADPVYFGMVVSSHTSAQTATVQFRDLMDTGTASVVPTLSLPGEPLGPSSRKTGLVITEVMYHPAVRGDGRNLEFVELFNSQPFFEDISNYKISGDVDFTFPPGTVLPSGAYLVIAKVPADIQAVYGIANVVGPYSGSLPNSSGTVRLRNRIGAVFQEVNYDSVPPWPVAADGTGHSLVLTRPSYGEDSPLAWSASDSKGGSPGVTDGVGTEPARSVVINEFLAHTDFPEVDFIELFNKGTQPLNLSGFWLSDDPATNKFRIPDGTIIAARGFLSFTETTLGFSLSSGGETIFLVNSNQNRVLDAVLFEGQANGVSSGRFPDGAPGFRELLTKTPGGTNTRPVLHDIVINEIMYYPISGNDDDQYVELYNKGTNAVSLSGWKFTAGISYTFPSNAVIPAGGYVVVGSSVSNLLAHYPGTLNSTNTFGGFGGRLAHGGERLALSKPDQLTNTAGTTYSVVSEVTYGSGGRWGQWAHGGGSSLELTDPHSDPLLAPNWADSDETGKAPYTTVQYTGLLDNGNGGYGPDQLQMFLQDPGECLVDDVEVFRGSETNVNRITNPSFDANSTGWFFQGTHIVSSRDATGGSLNSGCLHLRASGRGDTGANRIRTVLSPALNSGETATLRAKVRWLKGNAEILLRLHGNWLEAAGPLLLPTNLGTPGATNSHALPNIGPAIVDVSHSPILPAASQAIVVTARVSDPDGVSSVVLKYRNDSGGGATTTINMLDNGTGGDATAGDGLFSATIPGQNAGVIIAFYVQATDSFAPAGTTKFPNDAPGRECLVGFGEGNPIGTLGTFRTWVTQSNATYWANREKNSNEPLDASFAYGNFRVVYNMQTFYSGSPWHIGGFNGPTGNQCDYILRFPNDDMMMGANDYVISTVGNLGNDDTAQREQASFWMLGELDAPTLYRRHINMYCNGNRRGTIMESSQQPGADVIGEYFPDDSEGHLFKIEDAFEFDDAGSGFNATDAQLIQYLTTGGAKKTARYRSSWRPRAVNDSANEFNELFNLVDAVNATAPEPYTAQTLALVDMEEWMRVFAVEHIAGNWDAYGYNRGKNMYTYKPRNGRWIMIPWDIDFVLGSGSDGAQTGLFGANDPTITRMWNHPPFVRAYWRAYEDAVNGPMLPSKVGPVMDAKYAALSANGINVAAPTATLNFIAQRRAYIISQLATVAANFTVPVNNLNTASNLVTISGTAPIGVQTIRFNGVAWPITWTGVTSWQARLPLVPGANQFTVAGLDVRGHFVAGATNNVTVTYTGTLPSPAGNVVINEILFNPAVPDGEFIELFNNSATINYDLSGWQFNGLSYTFPPGSYLAPRSYLVLAKNRDVFGTTYGSTILVFDTFTGSLQNNGETLTLIQPGATPAQDLVVDKVKYEGAAPWSTNANGTGSSFQLIDPLQDNSRAGNWFCNYIPGSYTPGTNIPGSITPGGFIPGSTNYNLRFTSVSGNIGSTPRLLMYLGEVGEVYIDDLYLANGGTAEAGTNLIVNGDFETPLLGAPALTNFFTSVGLYHTNSAIATTNAHSGNNSLRIISTNNSSFALSRILYKDVPGTTNGQTCTLSFWYRPTFSVTNLYARFQSSTIGSSSIPTAILTPPFTADSNSPPVTNLPVIIPPITIAGAAFRTPGAINTNVTTLPAFPPLWLNEVQAENINGPTNSAGQRTAWLELYNAGTNVLTLTNLFLTANYTNLTNWAFPAGATIAPGEFKIIFADGLTNLSTLAELHTSFALPPGTGSLALSRRFNGQPQVIDYLNYTAALGRSYGSFPDGQSFDRQEFYYVTPGGTNNAAPPPLQVFINEWMADNTSTLADPADNDLEDWFEIYNPGPGTADLSGYYLTDNLTNKFQYLIPAGYTIPPGGHLLVWADNETGQNSTNRIDLHVNFKLAAAGEAIGLFAADGTQIDAVIFGAQTPNVSQGRYPDGTPNTQLMATPTPRAANLGNGNTAPTLGPIASTNLNEDTLYTFTATANDTDLPAQALTFTLAGHPPGATITPGGLFTWTPTEAQGPGVYNLSIIVTDNGTPSLSATQSFTLTVDEVNTAPNLTPIANTSIYEGFLLTFTATATATDLPAQALTFTLAGQPAGATITTGGLFTWTPAANQAPGTNDIQVIVADNGLPSLTATQTFTVIVIPPPRNLTITRTNDTEVILTWQAFAGRNYRVEYLETVDAPANAWAPVGGPLTATSDTLTFTDTIAPNAQRFYRIRLLGP